MNAGAAKQKYEHTVHYLLMIPKYFYLLGSIEFKKLNYFDAELSFIIKLVVFVDDMLEPSIAFSKVRYLLPK